MFYVELGIRHITDFAGFDHMLFLLALTLPLIWKQWKTLLLWVSYFTIGHSISLALAANGWVKIPADFVEWSIALTIALTVLLHMATSFKVKKFHGIMGLVFGLVHGLGFGSYYALIAQSDRFWWAWLPFNLGIELGQLMVVAALVFVYSVALALGMKQRTYQWLLSGVVLTLSAQMLIERMPF